MTKVRSDVESVLGNADQRGYKVGTLELRKNDTKPRKNDTIFGNQLRNTKTHYPDRLGRLLTSPTRPVDCRIEGEITVLFVCRYKVFILN